MAHERNRRRIGRREAIALLGLVTGIASAALLTGLLDHRPALVTMI